MLAIHFLLSYLSSILIQQLSLHVPTVIIANMLQSTRWGYTWIFNGTAAWQLTRLRFYQDYLSHLYKQSICSTIILSLAFDWFNSYLVYKLMKNKTGLILAGCPWFTYQQHSLLYLVEFYHFEMSLMNIQNSLTQLLSTNSILEWLSQPSWL